jgi:DNA-binding NarL/FixJ family response regulator
MVFERLSKMVIAEILRSIQLGLSDRKIARSLKVRRSTVAEVRKGNLLEVT